MQLAKLNNEAFIFMPKLLENLSYKFFIDIMWKGFEYITPLFLGSAGYIMKDWIVATLLGVGSFGIIACIKNHFDKQNKIDGKLIILDQFIVNINNLHQLNLCVHLHNCSNQIIDVEINAQNTKGSVDTATHLNFPINPKVTIPPYTRADLMLPFISLSSLDNQKELKIDINITANYGYHLQNKNLEIKHHLTTTFSKIKDDAGLIKYIPVVKS